MQIYTSNFDMIEQNIKDKLTYVSKGNALMTSYLYLYISIVIGETNMIVVADSISQANVIKEILEIKIKALRRGKVPNILSID